jgi:hypothetical protein
VRRLAVLGLALALLAAACGDDTSGTTGASTTGPVPTSAAGTTTTTTTAPATTTTTAPHDTTVVSEDGLVTLDIPGNALAEDPGITITVLDPDDYPEVLAGAAQNPNTIIYSLQPADLRFEAPARITREIPITNFDVGPGAVPLLALLVMDTAGEFHLLEDHALTRDTDSVFVSAEIDGFSTLITVYEQVHMEAKVVEVEDEAARTLGIDFRAVDGSELVASDLQVIEAAVDPTDGTVTATPGDRTATVACPPADGDTDEGETVSLGVRLDLVPTAADSGQVGLTGVPALAGADAAGSWLIRFPPTEACDKMPTLDGQTIQLGLYVDHPGGQVFVPDQNFRGGLSAFFGHLGTPIPDLWVGTILDANPDGVPGPQDVVWPPQPATVVDGETEFTLPLDRFGDYFLYFITAPFAEVPPLDSTLPMADFVPWLQQNELQDFTTVPLLGDIPFIGRVFSEESQLDEEVEMVILVRAELIDQLDE